MAYLSEKNYSSLTTFTELRKQSIKGAVVLVLAAISFALTPTSGMAKSASDQAYFNWLALQIKNNEFGMQENLRRRERLTAEFQIMYWKSNEYKKALHFFERAKRKIEKKTNRSYTHDTDRLSLSKLIDESLQLNPLVLHVNYQAREISSYSQHQAREISSYRQLESVLDERQKHREEFRELKDELEEINRNIERYDYSRKKLQYMYERVKKGISLEGDWTFVEPKDSSVIRIFWLPKYEKFFGRLIRVSDRLRYQGFPEKHVLWRDIWPIKKRAHYSAYGEFIDDYEAWEYTFNRGRADREECRLRLSEDGKILWNKSRQQTNTLKRIRAR